MPTVEDAPDSSGSPKAMSSGSSPISRSGTDSHISAFDIVRLVQCSKCSRPLQEAVRVPCGRALCRKCLPLTHRRRYVTYPPLEGREEGFICPFGDPVPNHEESRQTFWATQLKKCVADHSVADCSLDVTLNSIASAFRETLNISRATGVSAISDSSRSTSAGFNASSLVEAYELMESGRLPNHAQSPGKAMSTEGSTLVAEDDIFQRLKSSVRAEATCQLCFSLLMDPLTTPCGHTFCRSCLTRAFDQSHLCPFCRKQLLTALSVQSEPGNYHLSAILHTLFYEELQERVEAFNFEGLGYSEYGTLPLFVATIGFPTMRIFLHVFEARYQALIRYAMDAGDRRFGLVMRNRMRAAVGFQALHHHKTYGTVMLIERCEELADGRILIRAKGTSRFRILNATATAAGYLNAQIQRVEDIAITEEEILEYAEVSARFTGAMGGAPPAKYDRLPTQHLLGILKEYVTECRAKGLPWLSQRTLDAYGQPPDSASTYPYWLAAVLPIRTEEKYALLKTRSVRQRLKITAGWVDKLRSTEWSTEARPYTVLWLAACFFLAPLLVAFITSIFSGDPTSVSLYIGPVAFSFSIGGGAFPQPQSPLFGLGTRDRDRPEVGFVSASPMLSFSWLRNIFGTAVTQTGRTTYISKTLVFTVVAAVLLARAVRRLIGIARRKRVEQLMREAHRPPVGPNVQDNTPEWAMREGQRTEHFEVRRTAEVSIESEPVSQEGNGPPTQSNEAANAPSSG